MGVPQTCSWTMTAIWTISTATAKSRGPEFLADIVENWALEQWFEPLIGGLGIYGSTPYRGPFIHVDVRGTKVKVVVRIKAQLIPDHLEGKPHVLHPRRHVRPRGTVYRLPINLIDHPQR